jgi:hypothetical protein
MYPPVHHQEAIIQQAPPTAALILACMVSYPYNYSIDKSDFVNNNNQCTVCTSTVSK